MTDPGKCRALTATKARVKGAAIGHKYDYCIHDQQIKLYECSFQGFDPDVVMHTTACTPQHL